MTETRLWTSDGFRDDEWRRGEDETALAGNSKVILPLEVYLALDADLRAREAARIGVELQPGDALDTLVPHLGTLPLVALAFPAYTDGRSYSKAELLRSRYGYKGEVRATGDVLIDQVAHMLRVGFSSLEISNEVTRVRLKEGRPGGIPLCYQPTAKGADKAGSYSWRRISA